MSFALAGKLQSTAPLGAFFFLFFKEEAAGTSSVVQGLRLCGSQCRGPGFNPWSGNLIPHTTIKSSHGTWRGVTSQSGQRLKASTGCGSSSCKQREMKDWSYVKRGKTQEMIGVTGFHCSAMEY